MATEKNETVPSPSVSASPSHLPDGREGKEDGSTLVHSIEKANETGSAADSVETVKPAEIEATAGLEIPAGEYPLALKPGDDPEKAMRRISRRGFLWAAVYATGVIGGWEWFIRRPDSDNILSPLRAMLRVNERVARAYQSPKRLSPTFPERFVAEPVETGDVGLDDDSELDNWSLGIQHDADITYTLDLAAIKALPRVDVIAEHKCIEGWSRVVHWTGARFSDFAAKYGPRPLPDYVSIVTPDGQYYVGVEREAILQDQVLLCYELNGEPLTTDHGAPLRLVMPNKYGVKSLKRIGSIEFTNHKPADYWAEQGYDWYAGL